MRRGTLFIGLFVILAAAILGAATFLRSQPAVAITLAVSPTARQWIEAAVREFNAADLTLSSARRVQITVSEVDDLDLWREQFPWSASDHPDAWLPSASFSVGYAGSASLEIVQPTTARTVLLWAGRTPRVAALGAAFPGDPFGWGTAQQAAGQRWSSLGSDGGFVSFAFPLADHTITGFAVLLSGAAAFAETPDLSSFRLAAPVQDWLRPIIEGVPNFNSIGADAAAFMVRSAANGDLGLAMENQWLNVLAGRSDITVAYPEFAAVFDFPLVQWTDDTTPAETREAVALFGDWLMLPEQQSRLPEFGLRPAASPPTQPGDLFEQGSAAGIQRNPLLVPIVPPSINEARALLRWFGSVLP